MPSRPAGARVEEEDARDRSFQGARAISEAARKERIKGQRPGETGGNAHGRKVGMSLRLRLLCAFSRLFIKPGLAMIGDVRKARLRFERMAGLMLKPPPLAMLYRSVFEGPSDDRKMLFARCRVKDENTIILYFHGGGYVLGSPESHAALCAWLSSYSGMEVSAPDYRLAPEHPFPAALEDAEAAFEALRGKGYPAHRIILGGDSAGGGLALALLSRLLRRGIRPRALFAWSPWTDLTLSGESLLRNERSDCVLPSSRIVEMRDYYAGGADPHDPGLSPLLAEFPDCPPVLLQASQSEILLDDSLRMEARLREQGADVRLETWPGAIHVWQLYAGWLPEAREALENTARFIGRVPDRSLPAVDS